MEDISFASSTEYEEGEIPHDDSDLYTPLERPHIPMTAGTNMLLPSESDEDNNYKDSSSDSESSSTRYSSKIRKKAVPNQTESLNSKKKKYNIWSSDLQADILTSSLVDCSVDKANKRTRDVESYNYKLAMPNRLDKTSCINNSTSEYRDRTKHSAKRKSDGKFVENEDVNKGKEIKGANTISGNSRNIQCLSISINNTEEEIATDIANKLFEEKEELVLRALKILGKEAVISLFEETREKELSGGMMIMNGTRRRTPGGVFFYLLKTSESLPRSKINEVFAEDKKSAAKTKKQTANEMKKIRAAKFKEALAKDDFPTLLSRTELAIKEFKAKRLAEESSEVMNPPPSPATDGKECSSDGEDPKGLGSENGVRSFSRSNQLTVYDDMFE